ncbi:fimbrial assembly protein [Actinotalea sp. Marseille-Q4924]|uniref:fimbrial assembly protein n=1 Tax=Actinotalea sp. Marseille-Q4924 TaxID=2866571 RepID=UPI001CE4247D|nr:fimbrial assembly protein [Actinotalea sp. Marseille-Q4924]
MTATLERPAAPSGGKKNRSRSGGLVSTLPQVNLLPPEVYAARTLTRVKRWLAVVVVLALIIAAGIVALSVMTQQAVDEELAAEQLRTEALLEEQRQYAEVPVVLSQLDSIRTARELGMSTEVLWRDYISAIAASAPDSVSIETVSILAASPMEVPPAPLTPLDEAAVGTITFTANSLTVPDTAQWVEALGSVTGLTNAWFSSATITEDEELAYYTVTGTIQITEDARANRFAATEGEG